MEIQSFGRGWASITIHGNASMHLIHYHQKGGLNNFPPYFWHPHFFALATVGMGTLIGILGRNLARSSRSSVQLTLECYDLNLIPYIYVGQKDRWTACSVEMEGRSNPSDHNYPPPNSPENDGARGRDEMQHIGLGPLYISPWQRRELGLEIPQLAPGQNGHLSGWGYHCFMRLKIHSQAKNMEFMSNQHSTFFLFLG